MSGDSNFSKIHKLLDQINVRLRNLFLKRWRQDTCQDWSNISIPVFTSGIGSKMFEQALEIQKEAISSGDVSRWDTTLLTDVLLKCEFKNIKQDKQEWELLNDIKIVRNKLFHHHATNIEDELFEELWHKAVPVLIFLGGSTSDIQVLETPSDDAIANIEKAVTLKEKGNSAYKEAEFTEAVELYTKAISLSGIPTTEVAILYSNRSAAYLAMSGQDASRIEQEYLYLALQDAKEAINLNRTWYRGYFRAGNTYVALEKFEEALEFFDSALAFCPGRAEIVTARGNCLLKRRQSRRQEHPYPPQMPGSDHALREKINNRFGLRNDNTTAKQLLQLQAKYVDELLPGMSHVQQAHKLMLNGDYKRAAPLFAKAASLQNADGLYNLGLMYKNGQGVQQDFKMYIKLMKEAASQSNLLSDILPNTGVAEAENSLGLAYEEGLGVKEDLAEAARWYKQASDHGCGGGSNNLALLYMSGRGVPLDPYKGFSYWKLAASQGNFLAMHSLAIHFLENEQDSSQAREYFYQAIKHGNLDAKLNAEDFEKRLSAVEEKNKKIEAELKELEAIAGINSKGLSLKERSRNALNAVDPEAVIVLENLKKLYLQGEKDSSSPLESETGISLLGLGQPGVDFNYDEIEKYAQNGSASASRIVTAMQYFLTGASLLLGDGPRPPKNVLPVIIQKFAACFRIEEIVVKLTVEMRSNLLNIVESVLESVDPSETSVLDKEARICYVHTNPHTFKQCAVFVNCSKLKYPEEVAFHRLHSNLLGILSQHDDGLREAVKSLELFPNDIELLYSRAVHLRCIENSNTDDVISAYEKFISLAPPDHRKTPESFYAIANQYYKIGNQNWINNAMRSLQSDSKKGKKNRVKEDLSWISTVEEFYQKGLQAESIQLPCFLPYKSREKDMLEQVNLKMIEMLKNMNDVDPNTVKSTYAAVPKTPLKSTRSTVQSFGKFTNAVRVAEIKAHREALAKCQELSKNVKSRDMGKTTSAPYNKQKAPAQLIGLKPITFGAMDTLEDKVYEGYVLQVTSVEDTTGLVFASIRLALEDEKGDVMRAYIYNFPDKDLKLVEQKLGFGAKLSILNPYMRLASDGQFGIRVDDISSLFLQSPSVENRCRFCGSEGAKSRCGRCKRATYCNSTCQEHDWKILKHKLICSKNVSDDMKKEEKNVKTT